MKRTFIYATAFIHLAALAACSDSPATNPTPQSDASLSDVSDTTVATDGGMSEGWESSATAQSGNVLRVEVSYAAPEGTLGKVQWWKSGSADVRTTACYDGDIALWDMEAEATYEYRVMPCDEDGWGPVETFKTEELPEGFPTVDVATACKGCQTKYILTNMGGAAGAYAIILNVDGSVRWYQAMEKVEQVFFDASASLVYAQQNHSRQMAFSLAGKEELALDYGTGANPKFIHHDSFSADGKLHIVTATRHSDPALSQYIVDGVDVYDLATKTYVNSWSVDAAFSAEDFATMGSQGASGYWAPFFGSGAGTIDWGHLNSISPAKGGNTIASFRQLGVNGYQGRVVLFDATGKIIWSLGDSADFALAAGQWFAIQHHAQFVADDTVMLFDNGGLQQESRVLQIKLTFVNGMPESATYVREQKLGSKCSSRSSAFLYEGGDHLSDSLIVTCAPSAVFTEYSGSGEVLWQARLRALGKGGKDGAATGVYRGVPILSLPQP